MKSVSISKVEQGISQIMFKENSFDYFDFIKMKGEIAYENNYN